MQDIVINLSGSDASNIENFARSILDGWDPPSSLSTRTPKLVVRVQKNDKYAFDHTLLWLDARRLEHKDDNWKALAFDEREVKQDIE